MSATTAFADLRWPSSGSDFVRLAEQTTPADGRFLGASEVQRELGISIATGYGLMIDGIFSAYLRTGLIVTDENFELLTPEDQRAWERAIEEYTDACRY